MAKLMLSLVALLLVANGVLTVDPGMGFDYFGKHFDTYTLIKKLDFQMFNPVAPYNGHLVRFKRNDHCLDASLYLEGPGYVPTLNPCNINIPTQQWRHDQTKFEVAQKAFFPRIPFSDYTPCLECYQGEQNCDIRVYRCNNDEKVDQFELRIHPSQVDLQQKRLYFSIHNDKFMSNCLTYTHNTRYNQQMFNLTECTGTDDQSFYIDVDMRADIDAAVRNI